MLNPKISAYLGFSIKSGNLTMGFNAVETVKKGVYLLIVCHTASENSQKQARKLQQKFLCPLIVCEGDTLENVIKKPLCKFVAVRDRKLAQALLAVQEDGFRVKTGGNN